MVNTPDMPPDDPSDVSPESSPDTPDVLLVEVRVNADAVADAEDALAAARSVRDDSIQRAAKVYGMRAVGKAARLDVGRVSKICRPRTPLDKMLKGARASARRRDDP